MAIHLEIHLDRLLASAFFVEDVGQNATESIERARDRYGQIHVPGATSFELVVPENPDDTWVREHLLGPLVYYCESAGSPIPRCPGVFVSLFVGPRLYCLTVKDVIDWAGEALGMTVAQMLEAWGTHERETVLR